MKIKNLFSLTLLATLIFSFAGCDCHDDHSLDNDNSLIIGIWEYSYSVDVETNNDLISGAIKKYITENEADEDISTIEFKLYNTYTYTENDGTTVDGTYTYKDGILTMTSPIHPEGASGTLLIVNNTYSWVEDYKYDFVNADGSVDDESSELKEVFEQYESELSPLTIQDLTSVSKAEIVNTLTRK